MLHLGAENEGGLCWYVSCTSNKGEHVRAKPVVFSQGTAAFHTFHTGIKQAEIHISSVQFAGAIPTQHTKSYTLNIEEDSHGFGHIQGHLHKCSAPSASNGLVNSVVFEKDALV